MSRASVAGHRVYAIDGTDQPVDEVDVVAGLVHEGAAVEFPSATPLGGVVVFLRTGPEDVDRNHVDLPEALFFDRPLEELQGGVTPILLDDEEVDAGFVACPDHAQAVSPARGHGFLGHDMDPVPGSRDGLFRVEATGGA